MSELFDIPFSPEPELTRLRRKYAEAKDALDKAEQWEDETGEPVPKEVRLAFRIAINDLCSQETKDAKEGI